MDKRRPELSNQELNRILHMECGWKVHKIDRLDSFEDSNFVVKYENLRGSYLKEKMQAIVKISHRRNFCQQKAEKERKVMEHLKTDGFICTVCLPFPDDKWFYATDSGQFVIRLFSFIPGIPLKNCLHKIDSICMVKELGSFTGKLHDSLKKITKDIVLESRPNDPWILENSSCLRNLLPGIKHNTTEERENLILKILQKFEDNVMPLFKELQKDGNLHPLYIDAENTYKEIKFGLIDFNDIAYSPYLFEVAMVIRDLMVDVEDVDSIDIGGHFLNGYKEFCFISDKDLQLLPYCILVGLCQYIVVGESEFQNQPDNEYTRLGADNAWIMLQKLQNVTEEEMTRIWNRIMKS
ncbi:hydroxylysine kinase-like isoform X2 [Saccostrea echinata]|uniref:hydroxylysine kinase-like isoform X2 n=1 Tax=Saccostrea echinata TaxID=191078 RepID=UPI002A81C731|nr:hydroxylysine kinase-like isoform X2 [Saccostrea echinata]